MWLTLGVWACALAASACTVVVVLFMIHSRRAEVAMLAALNGLGDTHMMAIEALTTDLDRLKQRVLDLETGAL